MNRFALTIILFWLAANAALADEYRPAFLEMRQTGIEIYDVLWKIPALGQDKRLSLKVIFPTDVQIIEQTPPLFVRSSFIEYSTISRNGGLAGAKIEIDGLERVSTDVLVRIQRLDGSSETARLSAVSTSFNVRGSASFFDVLKTYLVFGVEHILHGFDHLLFIACLIFIAGTWRRILMTITGFTIAHSITLTLAALNLVRLPIPPIEAIIALSIVFLAREIALERRDTLTWRYPIAVSASFGLLHGFGFASALKDIGLPQTEIPTALLAFNVGVEIGQLLFVATVLVISMLILKCLSWFDLFNGNWLKRIKNPLAYSVGSLTMIWSVERVAGFWN